MLEVEGVVWIVFVFERVVWRKVEGLRLEGEGDFPSIMSPIVFALDSIMITTAVHTKVVKSNAANLFPLPTLSSGRCPNRWLDRILTA